MKTTPGPWHASRKSLFVNDLQNRIVAELRPRDERVANAQLIAAAPDLFKACSDWINWLDPDAPWREDAAEHEAKMLDAMRSAIAKATGSTH